MNARSMFTASIEALAADSALEALYSDVNSLGGTVEPGDADGAAQMLMLDKVLNVIERHRIATAVLSPGAASALRATGA